MPSSYASTNVYFTRLDLGTPRKQEYVAKGQSYLDCFELLKERFLGSLSLQQLDLLLTQIRLFAI
jgi:hypothetical protein